MLALETLNAFNKVREPPYYHMVWWFFLEKGVSLSEFDELPLPYIFAMLSTHSYIEDERARAMKRSKK